MKSKPVWIVVPVYERQNHLEKLIECLEKQSFNNYNLVVVDHGVKDLSVESNNRKEIIKGSPKVWWSGAVNLGINYIIENKPVNLDTPIVVLNDDVTFGPDYLSELLAAWGGNTSVIIGSTCVGTGSNIILHASMVLNKKKASLKYLYKGEKIDSINNKKKLVSSDVLKGRGTLIPVKVFREVGLYNEISLPHYKADHELVYRAKKRGFKVFVSLSAILFSTLDSPHQVDKSLESKRLVLFGRKSVNNLFDLLNYSYLCFNPFYGTYYFLLNASRILLKVIMFDTIIYRYYKMLKS